MTTVQLHLEPFAARWLSYYLNKPDSNPVKKNIRKIILLMIRPHETGIVKCPEGKVSISVELAELSQIGSQKVKQKFVDLRSAVFIEESWMSELNKFIENEFVDEIIRTVAIKVESGSEFKDAVFSVLDRYQIDDDEYSEERAFKKYQRMREDDPELARIYRNYKREKNK